MTGQGRAKGEYRRPTRRQFFGVAGVAAGAGILAACSGDEGDEPGNGPAASTTTSTTLPPAPDLTGDPFTLGVASGDPMSDRVMLWTRLAPSPLDGGGMPDDEVAVIWEVATDEAFGDIVSAGIVSAASEFGHSVHADAAGLEPDAWYHYRFRVGDWVSTTGRTRTTPSDDATVDEFTFGHSSCQSWESGYYNAYSDVVDSDIDLFVFLGDYIYEGGRSQGSKVRSHNSDEVTDLVGYRNRYAQYRSDPKLQAAHAHVPWVAIWDDHEVDNNYADSTSQDDDVSTEAFEQRRADAYQAWWEYMPVRMDAPTGPDLKTHRSVRYGQLANLFMLDTRQFRSPPACDVDGISLEPACDEVHEAGRTLTGDDQEQWLIEGLEQSPTTWNVIGNQVVMTELTIGDAILNYDQWDGYPANRARIVEAIDDAGLTNVVVITGDIHTGGVGDVTLGEGAEKKTVATELVGASISSLGDFPEGTSQLVESALPQVQYFNNLQRGWTLNRVTPDGWTAEMRVVEDNLVEGSSSSIDAEFSISPDRPGAERLS